MESDEHPKTYSMKLWVTDEVCAQSEFWKVKKSNGQLLAVNEDMYSGRNRLVWAPLELERRFARLLIDIKLDSAVTCGSCISDSETVFCSCIWLFYGGVSYCC